MEFEEAIKIAGDINKESGDLLRLLQHLSERNDSVTYEEQSNVVTNLNMLYGRINRLRHSVDGVKNCWGCGRPFLFGGHCGEYCNRTRSDGMTCAEYAKKRRRDNLPQPIKGKLKSRKETKSGKV